MNNLNPLLLQDNITQRVIILQVINMLGINSDSIMYEKHHYKGSFGFYFYPTNQSKIAKKYLKEIFPLDSIKKARKTAKTLTGFDPYTFLDKYNELLLRPFKFYKTDKLKIYLEDIYKKEPRLVTIFYILLDDVLKTVTFPSDFNIEDDLAQNIIITALNRDTGE